MNAPVQTPAIGNNRPPLVTAESLTKDFTRIETAIAVLEARAKEAPPVVEDDEDLAIITALVVDLRKAANRADELREETKAPYLEAGRVIQTFFKAYEARADKLKAEMEGRGGRYLKKKEEAERQVREAQEALTRAEAERLQQQAIAIAAAGKPEETKTAIAAAADAQVRATQATTAVAAKPAEMARTHTAGGTATLAEDFDVEIDWDKVDLDVLRPYMRRDEIEKAVRALLRARKDDIKTGALAVTGVRFIPTTKPQYR